MTYSFFHPQIKLMSQEKLDELKRSYAEMVIEGMDMDMLMELAVDGIIEQVKNYEYEDIKEEIVDFYGEDTWLRLTE